MGHARTVLCENDDTRKKERRSGVAAQQRTLRAARRSSRLDRLSVRRVLFVLEEPDEELAQRGEDQSGGHTHVKTDEAQG
jgi:hypothetical protein